MTSSQPGRDPNLLPTTGLSPDEFEDFTERLLSAYRSCAEPLRRIERVERWGRRGDKQDGIDFEGTWSDGKTAAWQCKRYDRLTVAHVKRAVEDCSFDADEYYLTYSGEASPAARYEMAKHDKWQLLDRRGLGRMLDDLPLHKRRQVLDTTWGVPTRKQFLRLAAEDAFLSIEDYAVGRRDLSNLLNDCGPLVGRTDELDGMASSLDRSGDWPPVILVTGPGGRGKTRLVTHALENYSDLNPMIPVLCLSPGRIQGTEALHELPHTPAVIFVDDAHRDPRSLNPLLQYARRTTGTQLVIASRISGRDQVRAELIESGMRAPQIHEVHIGDMSRGQARELVKSLAEGLNLSLAFTEHLVEQAVDSPYVAVLALNMVRRGELSGHIGLDKGFREQILLRYQEILTGNLDGFDAHTIRRALAAYAAVGPVDDENVELRSTLARFCEINLSTYLRLVVRLKDRGVLVAHNGISRVAPDVLADQILEGESAIDGQDTGFASELWETFSVQCRTRLVVTLSELDWRLIRQGGPSIIGRVETALHEEIASASLAGLMGALTTLEPLSYTQPNLLIDLLEVVRRRLATSELGTASTDVQPAAGSLYDHVRAAAGIPPLTATDLEHRLGKLYGQCASNAPDVLEKALDALWALRRRDTRATNPYSDHPARVLTEGLANLGERPDPSFPIRISERVEMWLAEPGLPHDVDTPMFALKPLLAKEGSRYVPTSRREISIRPFLVSPQAVRPLRESVKRILLVQASASEVRRAGAAVRLLGDALREPRGMFGQVISDDQIRAWEVDDKETLATLTAAANATESAVIRRLIRRQVEWSAEYSRSPSVRSAALALLINLDERADDLAEVLLGGFGLSTDRKGQEVPSLAEMEALMASEKQRKDSLSEDEVQAEHSAYVSARIAIRDEERALRLDLVVHSLLLDEPVTILDTVEQCCREIQLASATDTSVSGLQALLQSMAAAEPGLVGELVAAVASRPQGPLDDGLAVLLGAWAEHDEAKLLDWLDEFSSQREEVRHGVAMACGHYAWTERGDRFLNVVLTGAADVDDGVRNRFLQGSHRLLAKQPAKTVELLLGRDISRFSATHVLQGAADYDGLRWGQSLDEQGVVAVLNLLRRADWNDHTVQETFAGIAMNFPTAVLDHFLSYDPVEGLPFEVAGLAEAFDHSQSALVRWLIERAREPFKHQTMTITGLTMSSGMTSSQAAAIAEEVENLDSHTLLNLAQLLYDVPIWALQQPLVARELLTKATGLGTETAEAMRSRLSDAMRVHMVGTENGISEELDQALAVATQAAAAESTDGLRVLYEEAANLIAEQIADVGHRFNEEFG